MFFKFPADVIEKRSLRCHIRFDAHRASFVTLSDENEC